MYSNEDLNSAIQEGIFTQESVDRFRSFIAHKDSINLIDSENFKLVRGFNDIFVTVVIAVFLLSLLIFSKGFALFIAIASWVLSEIFVKKRRMALPAVVLTIAFLASLFFGTITLLKSTNEFANKDIMLLIAFTPTIIGAWYYWKRFHVPITIGLGIASVAGLIISLLVIIYPPLQNHIDIFIFLTGVGLFFVAMYWDSQDLQRVTHKSDVAFWVHLVASPLIVHSIFSMLGVFEKDGISTWVICGVIGLFVVLTILSLIVDRRVFMLSSLVYIIYAISEAFKKANIDSSTSLAGVFIGLFLIFISLNWGRNRKFLLSKLPNSIRAKVP